MRTLVISDLHLGCGITPGIFAGAVALAGLLAELARGPLRIVLNGDTFDFVAQEPYDASEPPQLSGRVPIEGALSTGILDIFAQALAGRGELLFRVGDHDRELAIPAVQHLLRGRMSLGPAPHPRVRFAPADLPTHLRIGGARVVLTHSLVHRADARDRWLARNLLNPLRREFGVGLADLLRPDYAAAILTTLAVNPTAARHVFREPPGDAAWRHLRGLDALAPALRLADALTRAGLTAHEQDVMTRALDPYDGGGTHDRALDTARLKLFRAALAGHGAPGGPARALCADERTTAQTLARQGRAAAVIAGGSHAAGWSEVDGDPTIVDTGAWTWLVDLPRTTDDVAAWQRCLDAWQRTPRIGGRPGLPAPMRTCFTGALLEPRPAGRGTVLALVEWRAGELLRLHERVLPAP